jgi:DNA-binding NarL/FixJ family response regulator
MSGRARPRMVMVVDDHPTFRLGLRALLDSSADLAICGEADDIRSAREGLGTHRPELVLVDLALGDESGLELVREICEAEPTLPVLVLSMRDEQLYAERALEAGACGYLMKTTPGDQILTAIRDGLADRVVLSPSVTQQLIRRKVRGGRADQSPLSQLSNRQLQVFELLGLGHQTRDIAAKLYVSPKTVETHIAAIKRRLGLSRLEELRKQAIVWVNTA